MNYTDNSVILFRKYLNEMATWIPIKPLIAISWKAQKLATTAVYIITCLIDYIMHCVVWPVFMHWYSVFRGPLMKFAFNKTILYLTSAIYRHDAWTKYVMYLKGLFLYQCNVITCSEYLADILSDLHMRIWISSISCIQKKSIFGSTATKLRYMQGWEEFQAVEIPIFHTSICLKA